jgi:amino acid transporter
MIKNWFKRVKNTKKTDDFVWFKKNKSKVILVCIIIVIGAAAFIFSLPSYLQILEINFKSVVLLIPFISIFASLIIWRWDGLIRGDLILMIATILLPALFFFFDYADKQILISELHSVALYENCETAGEILRAQDSQIPQARFNTDVLRDNASVILKLHSSNDDYAKHTVGNVLFGMEQANNVLNYMVTYDLNTAIVNQDAKFKALQGYLKEVKAAAEIVRQIFKCSSLTRGNI